MIEYLLNAIKVSAGEDAVIVANIAEDGEDITTGCGLMLHIGEDVIMINGEYVDDLWRFTIPADVSKGLNGRYWYCLCKDGNTLCFKQPIYFI